MAEYFNPGSLPGRRRHGGLSGGGRKQAVLCVALSAAWPCKPLRLRFSATVLPLSEVWPVKQTVW